MIAHNPDDIQVGVQTLQGLIVKEFMCRISHGISVIRLYPLPSGRQARYQEVTLGMLANGYSNHITIYVLCQVFFTTKAEPFNCRFFEDFREGIASWNSLLQRRTLKQKIEIMGELNASDDEGLT